MAGWSRYVGIVVGCALLDVWPTVDTAQLRADADQSPAPAQLLAPIEGTAAPSVVRRVDELLAQRLKQLRAFWPQRVEPRRLVRVELWGTLDEYRAATASRGAAIDNPAAYFAADGVIVLGFDGGRFYPALQAAQARSERLQADLREAEVNLAAQLRDDEKRYERTGTPRDVRKRLTAERRRTFQVAAAKWKSDIDRAEQDIRKTLDEALSRLAGAAAHELFHAYVDSCVYPSEQGALPLWLNEGLAQIIEQTPPTAPLGRNVRPDAARLRRWNEAREAGTAVALPELLAAESQRFLLHGDNPPADAARYYLAAWATTQQLLTEGRLEPSPALDRFVAAGVAEPIAQFQRWTGRPLSEWPQTPLR